MKRSAVAQWLLSVACQETKYGGMTQNTIVTNSSATSQATGSEYTQCDAQPFIAAAKCTGCFDALSTPTLNNWLLSCRQPVILFDQVRMPEKIIQKPQVTTTMSNSGVIHDLYQPTNKWKMTPELNQKNEKCSEAVCKQSSYTLLTGPTVDMQQSSFLDTDCHVVTEVHMDNGDRPHNLHLRQKCICVNECAVTTMPALRNVNGIGQQDPEMIVCRTFRQRPIRNLSTLLIVEYRAFWQISRKQASVHTTPDDPYTHIQ